jgi:hypothetical protein
MADSSTDGPSYADLDAGLYDVAPEGPGMFAGVPPAGGATYDEVGLAGLEAQGAGGRRPSYLHPGEDIGASYASVP